MIAVSDVLKAILVAYWDRYGRRSDEFHKFADYGRSICCLRRVFRWQIACPVNANGRSDKVPFMVTHLDFIFGNCHLILSIWPDPEGFCEQRSEQGLLMVSPTSVTSRLVSRIPSFLLERTRFA